VGKFPRITFDSQIMGGQACIRGLRIPVSIIINLLANGLSSKEIILQYPDLENADIDEALQYVAWLAKEESYPATGTDE
jgi:uncharacterized protein (DUF433 family)